MQVSYVRLYDIHPPLSLDDESIEFIPYTSDHVRPSIRSRWPVHGSLRNVFVGLAR